MRSWLPGLAAKDESEILTHRHGVWMRRQVWATGSAQLIRIVERWLVIEQALFSVSISLAKEDGWTGMGGPGHSAPFLGRLHADAGR